MPENHWVIFQRGYKSFSLFRVFDKLFLNLEKLFERNLASVSTHTDLAGEPLYFGLEIISICKMIESRIAWQVKKSHEF